MYTHNQKVDMLLVYGEAQQNSRRAVQLYREKYPGRDVPDSKVFVRLERTLNKIKTHFLQEKVKLFPEMFVTTIWLPGFYNFSIIIPKNL